MSATAPGAPTLQIYAHRGASAVAPENTMAAFRAAMSAGAHGVEMDVRVASGGGPVVMHDSDLLRVAGHAASTLDRTAEELGAIDIGSAFGPAFTGEGVPSLDQVIAALPRDTRFIFDLKTELRAERQVLTQAIAWRFADYELFDRAVAAAFDPAMLLALKACDANIPVGLILGPEVAAYAPRTWRLEALALSWLLPHARSVDDRLVSWAHVAGYRVVPWAVEDESSARWLAGCGVDGLIGDDPAMLRAAVGS